MVFFLHKIRQITLVTKNLIYIRLVFEAIMSSSTLIEVFGHILFSFTRGVTAEHYNPQEPEYTAQSFGYDPLQSTGRE